MADVKMAQIINPLSVSFVYFSVVFFFSNAAETLSIRLSRRSDVFF